MTVVVTYIGDGSTPLSAARCKSIARGIPAHDMFVYGGDVYDSGSTAEYTGAGGFNDTYGDNALNVSPQGQNLIAKMAFTPANHEYRTVNATTLKIDTYDTYWTGGTPARNASNYVAVDNTKTDPNAAYSGMTSADAQKRAAAQWAHLKSVDIQGWRLLFIDTARSGTDEGAFPTAGDYKAAVQALIDGAAHRKLIVFAHMARWSSGVSHTDAQQVNVDPLWQMVAPKAIAWVAGHNHHYERQFARTANGSVAAAQEDGCVPITCGAGGTGLNGFVGSYATPAALAFSNGTKFGFVKLTLEPSTAKVDWYAMGTDGLGTPTIENTVTLTAPSPAPSPAPQNITVTNATVGGGVLNWSATKTQTWTSLAPASGLSPGTIAVSVDPTGLAAGTYNDTVTVTSPETTNDPLTVAVQLVVTSAGAVFKVGSDSFGLVEATGVAAEFSRVDGLSLSEAAVIVVQAGRSDTFALSEAVSTAFFDDFSTDLWPSGRYTLIVGTGLLQRNAAENTEEATSLAEKKVILDHGARAYTDVEVSVDQLVSPGSHISPIIKQRYQSGQLYHLKTRYDGPNSGLNIQKFVNGVTTNLVAYNTLFARGTGWRRVTLKAVGNVITASHYALDDNRENPVHNATETVTLAGQDAADFGAGVTGDVGRRWVPGDLTWRADNFRVTPLGTPALAVQASGSDTFSVSDAAGTAAAIAVTDAAVLNDAASATAAIAAADAFLLSGEVSSLGTPPTFITAGDSFSVSDAAALIISLAASESFTFSEAAAVVVAQLSRSEAASLVEAAALVASLSASDAIALADVALAPAVSVQASDAAALTDSAAIAVSRLSSDAFVLSESMALLAQASRTDGASLSEVRGLSGLVTASDPFALTDVASLTAGLFKAASDAFTLADTALAPAVNINASDAFTLSESLSLAATLAASDNLALSELLSIASDLLASDTFTVLDFASLTDDARVRVLSAIVAAAVTIAGMTSAEQTSGATTAGIV